MLSTVSTRIVFYLIFLELGLVGINLAHVIAGLILGYSIGLPLAATFLCVLFLFYLIHNWLGMERLNREIQEIELRIEAFRTSNHV